MRVEVKLLPEPRRNSVNRPNHGDIHVRGILQVKEEVDLLPILKRLGQILLVDNVCEERAFCGDVQRVLVDDEIQS